MTTIRSFVAIELDDQVRQSLAGVQLDLRAVLPPQTVRWIAPESIHLTLQFLGDVPVNQTQPIVEALRGACSGIAAFSFDLIGLGVFPDRRRPRIVWVGINEPGGVLAVLHRRVGQALKPLGFPPEERTFTPHLTIGRATRSASPRDLTMAGEVVTRSDIGLIGRIDVHHVALMRSDLKPTGAVYTPQAILPLR
jgi:RNA 2',3'-cyclic 3'-phosphodiesterase